MASFSKPSVGDTGGGIARVKVRPRPRVPVVGLAISLRRQHGRETCERQSQPESPQNFQSVQDR